MKPSRRRLLRLLVLVLLLLPALSWGEDAVPYWGPPIPITYEGYSGMFMSPSDFSKVNSLIKRNADLEEKFSQIQTDTLILLEEDALLAQENSSLRETSRKLLLWASSTTLLSLSLILIILIGAGL